MSSVQSSAQIFRSMIHKRFVVERWPGQDDLCASTRNMLFVAVCCNTPALCYADIVDNGITHNGPFSLQTFTTDRSRCTSDDLNPSEAGIWYVNTIRTETRDENLEVAPASLEMVIVKNILAGCGAWGSSHITKFKQGEDKRYLSVIHIPPKNSVLIFCVCYLYLVSVL